MKQLKFAEDLPQKILEGSKTCTWRINDNKNISVDDELLFTNNNKEPFAKAKVTSVLVTKFKNLSDKDWVGHEKFNSKDEMYKTYSGYYKFKVNEETEVKIIKFELDLLIQNSKIHNNGVFAARDIKKGEEITSDYSDEMVPGTEMFCNCGSKNCKKIIRFK
ncbi:MAG: ASCH domain-containing protein [Nanoarchaeota archaeon]|nr:ASCH domain-containing protein [Nanoarchaeota archaeon]